MFEFAAEEGKALLPLLLPFCTDILKKLFPLTRVAAGLKEGCFEEKGMLETLGSFVAESNKSGDGKADDTGVLCELAWTEIP